MKYAFINDNMVAKIEEHESADLILDSHLYQHVIDVTAYTYGPEIEWSWENEVLFLKLPPVTSRQIRIALLSMGITEMTVLDSLNTLPEPTKSIAIVEWEYSTHFFRTHYLVGMVGQILGWSAQQLDELWVMAYKL